MARPYDVVIIGAGHNGLITAAYLAGRGLHALVIERRGVIGGAAATEPIFHGFQFDTGAHRIGPLEPRLWGDLELSRHGVELLDSDPTVFAPLVDRRRLLLWRDPARSAEAIREISKADAARWIPFTQLVAKAAGVLQAAYSATPPNVIAGGARDLWSGLKLAARLRRLGKRDMVEVMRILPMSVRELLDDWFESDVLKGTLAATGITGLFQGPMAAGTVFTFLHHHVGAAHGVLRPTTRVRGGIGKLAAGLAAVAAERGVEIRTDAEVDRVLVEDGRATGVVLEGGDEIRATRVVSNADPKHTFTQLVQPHDLNPEFSRKIANIKFKGACAKVHFALDALPDFTSLPGGGHHLTGVISISPSVEYLERAYDDAKYGDVSQRPYLEAVIPTVADPSLAPSGKHIMSVLVQYAPYSLRDGAWDDARRQRLGDAVLETLAEYAPNLPSAVLQRHVLTPLDLEETYGLTEGNIYHGELTMDQVFFMRPVPECALYRTPIANLYLCGAGTHPGGGVTGAPGYNAAREILRDVKRRRP
jgi:phytoene dehydrogenase-like protein